MAYTLYRFFRALRSMCAPITAVVGFSCLLTFIFILYQPTPGPGIAQRLGWQSWDIISNNEVNNSPLPSTNSSTGLESGTIPHGHEGVDWWNVTAQQQPTVDSASFPLDVWAPLLPHDTGCA